MIRLIAVQSPSNLLNVLCLLRFERSKSPNAATKDYLFLGGFFSNEETSNRLLSTILKISSLWQFEKIFNLSNLEQLVQTGALTLQQGALGLRKKFKDHEVHAVYVGRNYQLFNELILAAFPESESKAYGDSFGIHDSDSFPKRASNPQGLRRVSALTATTPLELGVDLFSRYPVTQVPEAFLTSVIKDASELFAETLFPYQRRVVDKFPSGCALILTTFEPGSEATSPMAEAKAYFDVVAMFVRPEIGILIKSHPRSADQHIDLLIGLLENHGYRYEYLKEISAIPVELIIPYLPIEKILTNFSCACIALRHVYPVEIVYGLGTEILNRTLLPHCQKEVSYHETARHLAMIQARVGKFAKILFKQWNGINGPEIPQVSPSISRQGFERPMVSNLTPAKSVKARKVVATHFPSVAVSLLMRFQSLEKRARKRLLRLVGTS